MINDLEAFKQLCSRPVEEVKIEGTDQTIQLQALSVKDRSDHRKLAEENPNDFYYLAAWLVARSCPQFEDSDVEELMQLGANHIESLSIEVCRISGMLPSSGEEELKN